MSNIVKIALEQNEKMYQEVVAYRKENETLLKEVLELKEKIARMELQLSDNKSNEDLKKIKSDLSYLASKQRSRDFDWDIGY